MAFDMFNIVAEYGAQDMHEAYSDMTQAMIDQQWDNTSTKTPENGGELLEQDSIGSSTYHCIEAWLSPTVADTSTGAKDVNDFMKLVFRDIHHITKRGMYYKFNNNYWIVHSYNEFTGLPQDAGIRRCNNALRMIDPDNGSVVSVPCVVNYDLMSPSAQVGRYVLTPNSHAEVYVQGNDDTRRLFTLNTRFLLGGRPFKLYAIQDLMDYDLTEEEPTYLTLDLYLDEIHDKDDLENKLAYNGTYSYVVSIDAEDMSLTNGSTGTLSATTTLNGEEVARSIAWSSSDSSIVTIDSDGTYTVKGSVGQSCKLYATLTDNTSVTDYITITVANASVVSAKIVLNPMFDTIRQYETITFTVEAEYNGTSYEMPDITSVTCSDSSVSIVNIGGNQYSITGVKPSSTKAILNVAVSNSNPSFTSTEAFYVSPTSMFG